MNIKSLNINNINIMSSRSRVKTLGISQDAFEFRNKRNTTPEEQKKNSLQRDLQRTMAWQQPNRSVRRTEVSNYAIEKVASAVNMYIREFNGMFLTFDDLKAMIRKTWLEISPIELRDVWEIIPHSKASLIEWAKEFSVPVDSFNIPQTESRKAEMPIIMVKLKEVAINYGNKFLIQTLKSRQLLYKEELLQLFERFQITNYKEDFDEFRSWAIYNSVMKRYGAELAIETEALCPYFQGVDFVEKQDFSPHEPVISQLISRTLTSLATQNFQQLKKSLLQYSHNDYIEEIHLRETFKYSLPSITNENLSLFINSLKLTIPASLQVPFRQINLPEFFSLFDNSPVTVLSRPNTKEKEDDKKINDDKKQYWICENFCVKYRDYNWEKDLIRKTFDVSVPLLANFRINDYNKSGALTLEVFHYTLKKSLPWMSDEEIFFLVDLGIRESGSIDERRTSDIKLDIESYKVSQTISAAWFPTGEQYNISYLYFIIVLERLSKD